jgi:hypothetical protein
MGIGTGAKIISLENTLIIHAIGGPVIAAVVSFSYFKKFNYTRPLQTAIAFALFILFMDFFVVSLLIVRNFEMFASILGTWVPFGSIFVATYLTGLYTPMPRKS